MDSYDSDYSYDDNYDDDDDDDDDDYDLPQSTEVESNDRQSYTVLKEEEIAKLQEDAIAEVSSVLSISQPAACFVLTQYNWNVINLNDDWFADEDRTRQKAGLLEKPVVQSDAKTQRICGICFDDYNYGSMYYAACGHPFCGDCWRGYVGTAIKDGAPCLMLRCPEPKCRAAVCSDLISVLMSKQEFEKYRHYLLKSYVEQETKIKWCPAPDCKYAVKFNRYETKNYDVSCLCSYSYCWNCTEESHRPVDCETVRKWTMKNKDDSQNASWILSNTKPCPKCKRPIQKNEGCHHMTCRAPCKYEFCWYCLAKFNDYKTRCCNGFDAYTAGNRHQLKELELEPEQKKLKEYLDRYLHYYERWANNKSSKEKAVESLNEVRNKHIKELVNRKQQYLTELELSFVIEAWQQIIECRQVLRWSYVYGYYMPEDNKMPKELFEEMQGHAEFSLEVLHKCAVTELQPFLDSQEELKVGFHDFRLKLERLTWATKGYFKKLVTALEHGLSEMDASSSSY